MGYVAWLRCLVSAGTRVKNMTPAVGKRYPDHRLPRRVGNHSWEMAMANLLCLLLGHQKKLVPLSSNRYCCRRCGFDFGVEVQQAPAPTVPPPPPTTVKRGAARRLHR